MKRLSLAAACMSLIWLIAPSANAQVKNTSDLFPSSTVAYLELTGTKHLAKEIASLTKGSFLNDYPASLQKFRLKNARNPYWMFNEMAYLSGFLTSHALDEFSKFEGGAIAVTQMAADGSKAPHAIGVLRTGDSNMVHFMMRMMMTSLKPVAEVEGVWLFQEERRYYEKEKFGPGGPQPQNPPRAQTRGPVVAIPDGALIIGSHKEDVADMVRRLKGKGKGPALTHNKDFMSAAQIRPKGGLFVYADMNALATIPSMLGELFYGGSHARGTFDDGEKKFEAPQADGCGGHAVGNRPMSGMQDLIRSFGTLGRISLSLSLDNGSLQIQGRINTDPKHPSGWSDFFTKRTLNRDLLHYVPADHTALFAFALPDGSAFWDKLDKTAPVFETDISLLLGVNVLDIAQFVGTAGHATADLGPMFVVEAVSEQKAGPLAQKLADVLKAKAELNGKIIVLSRDAKVAKEAMAMGQAKKGMLAQPWVAKATENLGEQHAALLLDVGSSLQHMMNSSTSSHGHFHDKKADIVPGVPGAGFPQQSQPNPAIDKRFARFAVQMGKAWAEVPPLVLTLGKNGRDFRIQGVQEGLQKSVAPTLDTFTHYYMHWTALRRYGFDGVGGVMEDRPLPPVIEKN